MAKNTKPKKVQYTAPVPESTRGCGHPSTFAGSRITQLSGLDTELAALADMTLSQMRVRWQEVSDKPVPQVRRTLLRLALAYELQAALHGGLSRRTKQRLAYLAGKNAAPHVPRPGMRLVREWNGALHTVNIDEDGLIRWQGKTWHSLSEVARAITGTRWSGPVFFGLKQRRVAG